MASHADVHLLCRSPIEKVGTVCVERGEPDIFMGRGFEVDPEPSATRTVRDRGKDWASVCATCTLKC